MDSEKFDDAIRKKITSIRHQYTEADITRIHYKVISQAKLVATGLSAVKIVGIAVFSAFTIGVLTWNVRLFNEKNELAAKVNRLQTELNEIKKQDPPAPETSAEHDVVSQVYTPENIEAKKSNKTEAQEVNPYMLSRKNALSSTANNTTKSNNKPEKGYQKSALQLEKPAAQKTALHTVENNTANKAGNEGKITGKEASVSNDINGTKEDVSSDKVLTDNTIVSDSEINDTLALAEKPENANALLPNIEAITEVNKSNRLKWLHYALGLHYEKARNQMAYGLVTQVFFTDRIGLSTGINKRLYNREFYRDARDFNNNDGRDFAKVVTIKDTNAIVDIQVKSALLQIPVSAVYMLPLKNDWSVAFSLGTDIDISAKQDIHYERRKRFSPDAGKMYDLTLSVPEKRFNNLNFSLGIQKTYKHFAFNISPFIKQQFNRTAYQRQLFNFGIDGKLLYTF